MPSLSSVSSATAASHVALLVMVAHVESASSHVSPPEEMSLNRTVAVGAVVVGVVGSVVVGYADGVDGADVFGAVGGPADTHVPVDVSTIKPAGCFAAQDSGVPPGSIAAHIFPTQVYPTLA